MSFNTSALPNRQLKHRLKTVLDIVVSIVLLLAGVSVLWMTFLRSPSTRGEPLKIPSDPIVVEGSVKGSMNAPTVMILYSDFECPYCRRFAREVLPMLERDYVASGRLSVVFSHFPLRRHQHAVAAATTADCAGQQGQFWQMHDFLFGLDRLEPFDPLKSAVALNLDVDVFSRCLASDLPTRIAGSSDAARKLGISGTPAFFIGTRLTDGRISVSKALQGARPVDEFRVAIDSVLNASTMGWWSRLFSMLVHDN